MVSLVSQDRSFQFVFHLADFVWLLLFLLNYLNLPIDLVGLHLTAQFVVVEVVSTSERVQMFAV